MEDRNGGVQCKMRKMLLMWMYTGSTARNGVCWDASFHVLFTAFVLKSFIQSRCIFKCYILLKLFSECFYVLDTIYYFHIIKTNNQLVVNLYSSICPAVVCNQSHHSPVRVLGGINLKFTN